MSVLEFRGNVKARTLVARDTQGAYIGELDLSRLSSSLIVGASDEADRLKLSYQADSRPRGHHMLQLASTIF
jgi:hypothetical protein